MFCWIYANEMMPQELVDLADAETLRELSTDSFDPRTWKEY
jgi:hypothetical protein